MIEKIDKTNIKEIHTLFTETVHNVNNKDYSLIQINKWAPLKSDLNEFGHRLLLNDTFVYTQDEMIVGYISVNNNLIDHLYTHKDYQRKGIAKALINYIYILK